MADTALCTGHVGFVREYLAKKGKLYYVTKIFYSLLPVFVSTLRKPDEIDFYQDRWWHRVSAPKYAKTCKAKNGDLFSWMHRISQRVDKMQQRAGARSEFTTMFIDAQLT